MIKQSFLIPAFIIACLLIKSQTSIPFTLSKNGHILFNAEINGVPGKFIFDTGAGINLVTKTFFDKLSGITTDGNYYTGFRATGDRMDVQLYKAKELRIGKKRYRDPDLTCLDVKDWGEISGIISLKSLEHDIISIDYKNSVLVISDAAEISMLKKNAKAIVPIQLDDSRGIALGILCYVRLNDTLKAQFVMDSGAGKDVFRINSRYMADLGIDPADSTNVRKTVFKSELKEGYQNVIYRANLDKISLFWAGTIMAQNIRGQFVEGLIYDGIMSLNWLGKKISISTPTKELIISD